MELTETDAKSHRPVKFGSDAALHVSSWPNVLLPTVVFGEVLYWDSVSACF